MNAEPIASAKTYAGLFFAILATFMYEIVLTRVFSVSLWYHFGFMALSIAMFGMTVGALVVYVRPQRYPLAQTHALLCKNALWLAGWMLVAFVIFLSLRILPYSNELGILKAASIISLGAIYILFAVPFFFSGLCTCLALTRFPDQVGKLYAADLTGGAAGCLAILATLYFMDAPSVVILIATLVSVSAFFFSLDTDSAVLKRTAAIASLSLALLTGLHVYLVNNNLPSLHVTWRRGVEQAHPLYEKWSPFSCVSIYPAFGKPFGWGLSDALPAQLNKPVEQRAVWIDSGAGTWMTEFKGDFRNVEYLKYDATNFAHYLRPDADVLIIGLGGGRDLLSALAFKQKSVVGIELNGTIINAVTKVYADYAGHLERFPGVHIVQDEARSYIARTNDKFDIIQASLIDTFAATAAGAYTLTENGLYTTEAWVEMLKHLKPRGVLSMTRFYSTDGMPDEIYRMCSLATASLKVLGISDPRPHVLLLAKAGKVGTILVSKEPFSDTDIERANALAAKMNFVVVLSPTSSTDPNLAKLVTPGESESLIRSFPLNISAPTDDMPFFFNTLRLQDIFAVKEWHFFQQISRGAVKVLGSLLVIVTVLTGLCIILPLSLSKDRVSMDKAWPHLLFFSFIGLGFMLAEVASMQRFTIMLGHPVFGLAVVLFSLLIGGGVGSLTTTSIKDDRFRLPALIRLIGLVVALAAADAVSLLVCRDFPSASTPTRVALTVAILMSMGTFMGMAFPLGMRLAAQKLPSMKAWLWGVNGATSVLASVAAVAISMTWGIQATFVAAIACYVIAAASFAIASLPNRG